MRKSLIKKISGLICSSVMIKGLGFLFRIYLSKTAGAEGCGLYHLVLSVYTFGAGLASIGMNQTVARLVSKNIKDARKILRTALTVTGAVSFIVMLVFLNSGEYIACNILKDSRTISAVKAVSVTIPAIGIFSVLSGYFNGLLKVGYPAKGQLVEQLIRTFFVFIFAQKGFSMGLEKGIFTVTMGIILGEYGSMLYLLFAFRMTLKNEKDSCSLKNYLPELLKGALPIALTGYIATFLHTLENILLPIKLVSSGLTNSQGVSALGLIKGMAFPLVLFPGIIQGAICTLALPEISRASGDKVSLKNKTTLVLLSAFLTGGFSLLFFTVFANPLTRIVYGSTESAFYVRTLSIALPFLFFNMSGVSIFNGMGKQAYSLITGTVSGIIKLLGIIIFVPAFGINGYLFFYLFSEICGFLMTFLLIYNTIYKKNDYFIYKLPKIRKKSKNHLKY